MGEDYSTLLSLRLTKSWTKQLYLHNQPDIDLIILA